MTTTSDRLARLVAPVADDLGVSVYDIEDASGTLRIMLDRPGGVDVDTLTDASRRISHAMDADGSFASTSLLEVSSPGLERKLRTPDHYAGAVGELVKVKLRPGVDGDRRLDGTLTEASETSITVTPSDGSPARSVLLADVTSAHTVFVWQAAPKPGKGPKGQRPKGSASATDIVLDIDADTDEDDSDTDETEATP